MQLSRYLKDGGRGEASCGLTSGDDPAYAEQPRMGLPLTRPLALPQSDDHQARRASRPERGLSLKDRASALRTAGVLVEAEAEPTS